MPSSTIHSHISGNVEKEKISYNIIKKEMDVIKIIIYSPLWETMKAKGITQYQLIHNYNFSTGTLDSLRKNKSITLNTLHDICEILNCDITDIVEFTKE